MLIVLGLIVLAAAGYLLLGKSDVGAAVTATTDGKSIAESTFVNLTAEIEPVKFDTSILSDVRFKNLVDIHIIVTPEPTGRKDPFAPFAGAAPATR